MRIAAFVVVKNDEFYIDMALKSVLPYVCGVYVQDQMSDDGTYEKVLEMKRDLGVPEGGKIVVEQCETGVGRFSREYNEPHFRSMAVERCEQVFNPDWILKLDADEIYTPYFFKALLELGIGGKHHSDFGRRNEFKAVRVAGDRFISKTHRSVHPTSFEQSPRGVNFVDPHTQLWRAGMGVRYIANPAFERFHPILDPDPWPQYWMEGVANIHLHRLFGPKAYPFWSEGTDIIDKAKPLYPPTSCPKWYNSAVNMGNSEETNFQWPSYVTEKWEKWEGGIW